MRFRNGERPPPRSADSDLSNERLPDRLNNHFTPRLRPAQSPLPRERLAYLAGRLHDLGPRPLFEFLREIEAGANLHERLERYASLPADFIAALGGDRFPPPKIMGGGRA
jgi:hypothetical protein